MRRWWRTGLTPDARGCAAQAASQGNDRNLYKAYAEMSTKLSRQIHLRGLLRFKRTAQSIPVEQVRAYDTMCVSARSRARVCGATVLVCV